MIAKRVLAAIVFNLQLSQIHRNSEYNGWVFPPIVKAKP